MFLLSVLLVYGPKKIDFIPIFFPKPKPYVFHPPPAVPLPPHYEYTPPPLVIPRTRPLQPFLHDDHEMNSLQRIVEQFENSERAHDNALQYIREFQEVFPGEQIWWPVEFDDYFQFR